MPAFIRYLAIVLATGGLLAVPAGAAELRIDVTGLRSADGKIHLAVYDRPEEFPSGDKRLFGTVVEAAAEKVQIVLGDLKPGTYAVAAYHDENANDKFDKGLFGIPLEGYAFSNDATVFFGPPAFAEAAVTVNADGARITITMTYW